MECENNSYISFFLGIRKYKKILDITKKSARINNKFLEIDFQIVI